MHWPHQPKDWTSFPSECLWYLLPGLLDHLIFLAVSAAIFGFLRLNRIEHPAKFSTLIRFQGWLLCCAMLMNAAWSCTVWGRFYWSVDYTSDFSPFHPVATSVISQSWGDDLKGDLNGLSQHQLNALWLIFSATCWFAAYRITRISAGPRPFSKCGDNNAIRPYLAPHLEHPRT